MSQSADKNLARIAHQEAGHAVAAYILGFGVGSINADPSGEPETKFVKNPLELIATDGGNVWRLRYGILLRAGEVAQNRAVPGCARQGCDTDSAQYSFDGRPPDLSDTERWDADVYTRCANLVDRNWRTIEMLAAALVELPEIDGATATGIIESVVSIQR